MKKFEGFMKGVNLGGWLSQRVENSKEHLDTFISEDDIKQIASWNLDHVRLPIDYDIIEEEDGTFKDSGFAYIDNCIGWCEKYGLHIILDLHKTYGYSFDPLDKGDLEIFFHKEELQDRFVKTWSEIARRYASKSHTVAFELLNEIVSPNVVNEWNDIVKKTVTAIRAIAPDSYIVFGGVCYNSVVSVPLLIKPFSDKLIYTFHCYDPLVFTHQKAYWVENMTDDFEMKYPDTIKNYQKASDKFSREATKAVYDATVENVGPEFFEEIFKPALDFAKENDVPLYCGEYGVIDRAPVEDSLRWLKDINSVFENHGIGRCLWNYKNKDYGIADSHYAPIRDEMIKLL